MKYFFLLLVITLFSLQHYNFDVVFEGSIFLNNWGNHYILSQPGNSPETFLFNVTFLIDYVILLANLVNQKTELLSRIYK